MVLRGKVSSRGQTLNSWLCKVHLAVLCFPVHMKSWIRVSFTVLGLGPLAVIHLKARQVPSHGPRCSHAHCLCQSFKSKLEEATIPSELRKLLDISFQDNFRVGLTVREKRSKTF